MLIVLFILGLILSAIMFKVALECDFDIISFISVGVAVLFLFAIIGLFITLVSYSIDLSNLSAAETEIAILEKENEYIKSQITDIKEDKNFDEFQIRLISELSEKFSTNKANIEYYKKLPSREDSIRWWLYFGGKGKNAN